MSKTDSTADYMPSFLRLCISDPESATLNFSWKIANFKLLVDNWTNQTSKSFNVYSECCKIYFKLTLTSTDRPSGELVRFSFRIDTASDMDVDKHLKEDHLVEHISCSQYILCRKGAKMYAVTKSYFNKLQFNFQLTSEQFEDLESDVFEFRTELRLSRVPVCASTTIEFLEPPGDLFVNLGHLLETKAFCDFTIKTAGESFRVHRAILAARSPVFGAMFSAGLKESKNDLVELDDVDAESMRIFLRYIYTDKLEFEESASVDLKLTIFQMADQYHIPRLRALSELVLIKSLSKETVCEILKVADTHGAKYLRHNGLVYVRLHRTALAEQEDIPIMIAHSKELGRDVVKALSNTDIELPCDEKSCNLEQKREVDAKEV